MGKLRGKFSEALHPRDPQGRFKGTSAGERKSRNLKRKTAAGAAIGTLIPVPGAGSVTGAAVGAAIAARQNKKGKTPEYGEYSAKRSARKKAAAGRRSAKATAKAAKKSAKSNKKK